MQLSMINWNIGQYCSILDSFKSMTQIESTMVSEPKFREMKAIKEKIESWGLTYFILSCINLQKLI